MRLCPDRFVDIYEVPGCQINSQWGQQELLQRSLSHELAAYFSDLYLYCDLMKRSHYQKYVKLHKSVKLTFTNIRGLRSNFVGCESFLESNPPDILALYESKVEDSVDSNKLSVRGCSEGFCISHAWSCCLYKEWSSFCQELFSGNLSGFVFMFSTGFTYYGALLTFPLLIITFVFMCTVFDVISSNIFWSAHLLICLSLETLTSIKRTD